MQSSSTVAELRNPSNMSDSGYTPVVFPGKTQTRLFRLRWWRVDARTGSSLSSIRWLASRAIQFLWFRLLWAPLTREIALELRSLPARIGTIYATRVYRSGVAVGPLGTGPQSARYMRTHACIRDMQRITSRYRWATSLDYLLMAEAWNLGAEWQSGLCNDRSDKVCSETSRTEP